MTSYLIQGHGRVNRVLVGGGEGRWWGSMACGIDYLGNVASGATFVVWGPFGHANDVDGEMTSEDYTLDAAGPGPAYRLVFTRDAIDVSVHSSAAGEGILVHEVLSTFDIAPCE